jgi:hypothetical protein
MTMPDTKSSRSAQDDSVTHAPEAGEPTETGRAGQDQKTDPSATSEKTRPGEARQGEDFESGRPDAQP